MSAIVRDCGWSRCGPVLVLVASVLLAGSKANAQGKPSKGPTPDFTVVMKMAADGGFASWDAAGAVVDTGRFLQAEGWRDSEGRWWARYQFDPYDPPDDLQKMGAFEIVLPVTFDLRTEYEVLFIAGPDGYRNGANVFEGAWAVGTATASIRQQSERRWDWWNEKWVQVHFQVITWTVEGFFLP